MGHLGSFEEAVHAVVAEEERMVTRSSAISLIVNQRAGGLRNSQPLSELIATLERHGLRPEPMLVGKPPGKRSHEAQKR